MYSVCRIEDNPEDDSNIAEQPSTEVPPADTTNTTAEQSEAHPEEHNNSTNKNENWNDKVKEMGYKREERIQKFMEEAAHLTNRSLSDKEWSQFTLMVDILVADLNNLIATKPSHHPTTNWKKRQRRQPPTARRTTPWPRAPPPPPDESDDAQSSQESFQPESSQQPPSASQHHHKKNNQSQRAREASKLQKW